MILIADKERLKKLPKPARPCSLDKDGNTVSTPADSLVSDRISKALIRACETIITVDGVKCRVNKARTLPTTGRYETTVSIIPYLVNRSLENFIKPPNMGPIHEAWILDYIKEYLSVESILNIKDQLERIAFEKT